MFPNRNKKNSNNPILAQEIIKKRSGLLWLIPLLVLFLIFLYWYFHHSESSIIKRTNSSTHIIQQRWAKQEENVTLPDGVTITLPNNSLEFNLLKFIQNTYQNPRHFIWFDSDQIIFDSGEDKIKIEAQNQIKNIAAILKAYPNVKIKIGGYTDSIGNTDQNLDLSLARAEKIKKMLINLNVPAERLIVEGYGENHPIASNDSPNGRAKNRRVAILVINK
ncbi:MAG: OmpA family protein [Candidatus Dasytiphilus stammeri]